MYVGGASPEVMYHLCATSMLHYHDYCICSETADNMSNTSPPTFNLVRGQFHRSLQGRTVHVDIQTATAHLPTWHGWRGVFYPFQSSLDGRGCLTDSVPYALLPDHSNFIIYNSCFLKSVKSLKCSTVLWSVVPDCCRCQAHRVDTQRDQPGFL